MSYSRFTAERIWRLVERRWVRNTSVLLSSIFFMEASVVIGCLMTAWASILFLRGTERWGYLGFLGVLGFLHFTEVRIFLIRVPWIPFTILVCADRAFLTAPFLAFLLAGF